jgi:membrane fusion protein (multidrug efflux system)
MRTASRFVLVIVLLALVLGGIFGWKFYQISQMQARFSQPQPPAVVDATKARVLTWTPAIKSVGSTQAINGVQVANEVPGVVEEIAFESGQQVEQGEVLLRLDSAIDEAALRTRRAEAQLAQREFDRLADLLPQRAISQAEYDEAQANLEAAQARVNEAEAQLDKKVLRAPFAGTLGLRLADLGEYLPAGTPIVEINMLDPIYVDYSVSERELSRLSVGDTVKVSVAVAPDTVFDGQVSAVNSSVSPETRTVRIRATLDNPNRILQPGMFATILTLNPNDRELVAVPRTAISYNTYGDFVFALTENDEGELIAERRDVETGDTREGMVEILEGLEAGEQVVRTGLLRLRAGQRVQIQAEEEQPEPTDADTGQANAGTGQNSTGGAVAGGAVESSDRAAQTDAEAAS